MKLNPQLSRTEKLAEQNRDLIERQSRIISELTESIKDIVELLKLRK